MTNPERYSPATFNEKPITVKELKALLAPYPDDAKIGQYAMGGCLIIEMPDNSHYTIDLDNGNTYPEPYVSK